MARAHGFRVYVVQAFANRRKGTSPLDAASTSTVRNDIFELLETLHSQGTQTFPPRAAKPGEPEKPTISVTVHEPVVVDQGLIHVTVAMGETGSHRLATRAKKKPKKLEKWSPEQDHMVTFLFPSSTEPRFLLVVQATRRRDPHKRLLSLLARESYERRKAAQAAEKALRRERRASGEAQEEPTPFYKLVFEASQAADNEYLDSILSNADSATATFKSTRPSSRGSIRPVVDRVLQISLRDENVQNVGRSIGRSWSNRRRSGGKTSRSEGVSELAALMYDQELLEEGEGDRYESAAVSVRTKGQDSTTIAVDTLRDVFTYPVSDGVPSTYFYYDKVAPRVETIARQEQLEITNIDPREVDECLKGLTQDL